MFFYASYTVENGWRTEYLIFDDTLKYDRNAIVSKRVKYDRLRSGVFDLDCNIEDLRMPLGRAHLTVLNNDFSNDDSEKENICRYLLLDYDGRVLLIEYNAFRFPLRFFVV